MPEGDFCFTYCAPEPRIHPCKSHLAWFRCFALPHHNSTPADLPVSPKLFAILLIAVIASRLPFLQLGYGSDADAWRVAHTASQLWHTGKYEPSRLPGYPLHELLVTPLVASGGALASNAGTLLGCLLLLLVWKQLTELETTHPSILIISLAFAPFVWKSSTTTMDYIW